MDLADKKNGGGGLLGVCEHFHTALPAGVRDHLMGKNPDDIDIATTAKPHQVENFSKRSRRCLQCDAGLWKTIFRSSCHLPRGKGVMKRSSSDKVSLRSRKKMPDAGIYGKRPFMILCQRDTDYVGGGRYQALVIRAIGP